VNQNYTYTAFPLNLRFVSHYPILSVIRPPIIGPVYVG